MPLANIRCNIRKQAIGFLKSIVRGIGGECHTADGSNCPVPWPATELTVSSLFYLIDWSRSEMIRDLKPVFQLFQYQKATKKLEKQHLQIERNTTVLTL